MHISVYTRHFPTCEKNEDRYWRRCKCPKWLYCAEWKPDRRSAKTRSWSRAEAIAKGIEDGSITRNDSRSVKDAVDDFLLDKKQQNISSEWYDKLDHLLQDGLVSYCEKWEIKSLLDFDVEHAKAFRATWTGNATTRAKKQERLRSFFLYCVRHKWIRDNPAALLSRIKVDRVPTDYFTTEDYEKIMAAIDEYHPRGSDIELRRRRARAMINLLRWSGLRIGDACRLERSRLWENDRLFLYMAKTKEPVSVLLPKAVAQELRDLPNGNPRYFFWTGNGDPKTVVDDWWRTLNRIFKRAKLGKRAHAHMTRDGFAVRLLLTGTPMDQVSLLLGHSSIKITERHYAPFSKARQEQLEEAVRRSWS